MSTVGEREWRARRAANAAGEARRTSASTRGRISAGARGLGDFLARTANRNRVNPLGVGLPTGRSRGRRTAQEAVAQEQPQGRIAQLRQRLGLA